MKRAILWVVAMLLSGCSQVPKGEVSGSYKFDGHDVAMHFVRAKVGKPIDGASAVDIVMSEKEGKSEFVSMDEYGSSLQLTVYRAKDGSFKIDSSAFKHSSMHGSGGGTGLVQLKDVAESNGEISGEVFTKPDTKIMDQTLDVDLKFKTSVLK